MNKKAQTLIIIIIVLLVVVGGILFLVLKPSTKKTVLDCYGSDLTKIICTPKEIIEFTYEFERNLISCKPSEGTFALGGEPWIGLFRGYKILGVQNNYCVIKFWYLENNKAPTPSELMDKEMTCRFADSERTLEEVYEANSEQCSGQLMDAINEFSGDNESSNINNIIGDESSLELKIIVPKSEYKVGETVETSSFDLTYEGEPFKGAIIYIVGREGFREYLYASQWVTIQAGMTLENKVGFRAFEINEKRASFWQKSFNEEGKYTYSIAVYDCESINEAFGITSCGDDDLKIDGEEIMEKVTPLKRATETIIVEG